MMTPTPSHLGVAYSVPPPTIVTTPGGMSLNLSRRPHHAGPRPPGRPASSKPLKASKTAKKNLHFPDWGEFYPLLVQFKEREGHCVVPLKHSESGKKIGFWLMVQNIHRKTGMISNERRHLLESLGVNWKFQVSTWDFNFLLLLQFRDREGHVRIPVRHVEDGQRLGVWVRMHRDHRNSGTLCPEKERRLNEIGFIWKAHDGKYDTMCRALAQFKEREGHCDVYLRHIEYLDGGVLKLGHWLWHQRLYRARATLKAERVNRLESMGVKWHKNEIAEEYFDRNFDLLLAFQEREGHVRVPTKHQEGSGNNQLGAWLATQRSLGRHGLLELDRRKWLEVAGVEWGEWESRGTQEENEGEEEKTPNANTG
jgi:hypothetical protein